MATICGTGVPAGWGQGAGVRWGPGQCGGKPARFGKAASPRSGCLSARAAAGAAVLSVSPFASHAAG